MKKCECRVCTQWAHIGPIVESRNPELLIKLVDELYSAWAETDTDLQQLKLTQLTQKGESSQEKSSVPD